MYYYKSSIYFYWVFSRKGDLNVSIPWLKVSTDFYRREVKTQ